MTVLVPGVSRLEVIGSNVRNSTVVAAFLTADDRQAVLEWRLNMQNRELETVNGIRRYPARRAVERQAEMLDAQAARSLQRDLLEQVVCRLGDGSCANAHAATLDRATVGQPSRSAPSLLQLQRQYGNHYVQRVLGLARKGEVEGLIP